MPFAPHGRNYPVVLVVDDDRDNLMLIGHQIAQFLDCSIVSAADGKSALIMAGLSQPDLILLDMMLPDIDGIQIIRRLKQEQKTSQIPIIAVTALAYPRDRELAFQAGCNDYVCKPYTLEVLEAIIHRHLKPPSMVEVSRLSNL